MFGLILAGGQSSRMGSPKSHLLYNNSLQYTRVHELLKPLCEQVFVSTSRQNPQTFQLPCIFDSGEFEGHGPVSGILSAMLFYPEADWIMVACDYPYLKTEHLYPLLDFQGENNHIVVYKNTNSMRIEPLVGIYRHSAFKALFQCLKAGNDSLRKCIEQTESAPSLPITETSFLKSVDNPEEYALALQQLSQG